ncbi:MAG: ABC transporter permease [bacterium]
MRLWSIFLKSMKEQLRSGWTLAIIISFAPLFVFAYWLFLGGGSTTYGVLLLNEDRGIRQSDNSIRRYSNGAIASLSKISYPDGQQILRIIPVTERVEAEAKLKDRVASTLLIIPPTFSEALQSRDTSIVSRLVIVGDLSNPYYAVAAVLSSAALDDYIKQVCGVKLPVQMIEEPLGSSATRTEFELYVPPLLILAIVLMLFQTAMTVAREVESGTLRRLQLSQCTSFDILGGISLTQVLISILTVVLTFYTAVAFGFRSAGSLWIAMLLGVVTSFGVIGVGLLIACFSKSVSDAFIFANIPLVFLMIFTGAMFPLPPVNLFMVGGRAINLFEILPPTHAVVAINKVLTLGAGLGDVLYELVALTVLSVTYFLLGVWLFQRLRMKAQ